MEVFLTDVLHFRWDEVHPMAEELEHVSSDELVSRLDAYLGFPRVDPHGDPIPDSNGKLVAAGQQLLAEGLIATMYCVSGVNDHSSAFLQFLAKKGLKPGTTFTILKSTTMIKVCSSVSTILHRPISVTKFQKAF